MNGFLNKLASRSLGLEEAIRPRLPSLFEPLPETGMPALPPVFAEEAPGESTRLEESARRAPVTRQPENPSFAQTPTAPVPPAGTDRIASLVREPETHEPLEKSPSSRVGGHVSLGPRDVPVERVLSDIRSEHSTVEPRPLRAVRPQAVRSISGEEPFQPQVKVIRPDVVRTTAVREDGMPVTPKVSAFPSRPAVRVDTTSQTESPGFANSSPQSGTLDALLGKTASAPSNPGTVRGEMPKAFLATPPFPETARRGPWQKAPEPVVQVTIGRIEVRAELPGPRPPVKERLAPKPMNLDEYLRRRTGRRSE